jgi:hypothetical protein
MVYHEILAQLIHQLKIGKAVRFAFKIGRLASRNGELSWKSCGSEGAVLKQIDKDAETNSRYSKITASSSF